jgi:hypothetical protein
MKSLTELRRMLKKSIRPWINFPPKKYLAKSGKSQILASIGNYWRKITLLFLALQVKSDVFLRSEETGRTRLRKASFFALSSPKTCQSSEKNSGKCSNSRISSSKRAYMNHFAKIMTTSNFISSLNKKLRGLFRITKISIIYEPYFRSS